MKIFYAYIAYNKKHDKFYIGQTNNLERRESEHRLGLSAYTSKFDGEWKILYYEKFKTRSEAMRREKFLKNQKLSTKNFAKCSAQLARVPSPRDLHPEGRRFALSIQRDTPSSTKYKTPRKPGSFSYQEETV